MHRQVQKTASNKMIMMTPQQLNVSGLMLYSLALAAVLFPTASAEGGVSINRTFLDQVQKSFELSLVSFQDDVVGNEATYISQENLETLSCFKRYFDSEVIDQALVAKFDGVCYGVFRGTHGRADWGQNFNLGNAGSDSCHGRLGYYEAYVNDYQAEFESDLDSCIASCSSGDGGAGVDCPLVLSGFSQGGAVAVIASLFWQHKNPNVITFGAPSAVRAPCAAIHEENHFRFITANSDNLGMWYDPVVMAAGFGTVHFGHPIIIGSDQAAANQPASPAINDDLTRHPVDVTISAHSSAQYRDRIEMMNNAPNFPIRAIGFRNDVQCGYNDECESGRCDGLFPPYICKPKEGSCGQCNEDSDCASGSCRLMSTRMVCAESNGKMADSCYCNFSRDCQSGRCEGVFPPYQCHARLGSGASCNENSDCDSNNCRFKWFQWKCA